MRILSPKQVWTAALGELQLQVARPLFDTFLRETSAVGLEGDCLVVGTTSPFAAEYLEKRLCGVVQQSVERVAQRPLEVRFRVAMADAAPASPGDASPGPDPAGSGAPPESESASALPMDVRYTFSTFVVGRNNELANAAAVAAARYPGRKFNPIFLYSGVGLGKTHLLQAVGQQLAGDGVKVVYVSSDQFTTDFVRSVREGWTQGFRHKYRGAGALLIDDVQLLSGKEQTQEGLFHIFNELHQSNRQIVVTSDRSPRSLVALEDRLRSRFEWGLAADIQPPDLETRVAILRAKADWMGVQVPDEVLETIGRGPCRSIRELEGHLNRVVALADLTGQPVDRETAERALGGVEQAIDAQSASVEAVLESVARFYRTTHDALLGPRRDRATARARHMAMYLLRGSALQSLSDIGRILGGRDHSTVYHACGKIESLLGTDAAIRQEVASLREALAAHGRGRRPR